MRQLAGLANRYGVVTLAICLAGTLRLCALPEVESSGIPRVPAPAPAQSKAGIVSPEQLLNHALVLQSKLTLRDLNASIRMLHQSALLFHASKNPRGEASAEIAEGDVDQMISAYPAALAAYRRALSVPNGQAEQRCETYIRIARNYANTGQSAFAQTSLESAIRACGTIQELSTQSDLEEAQGEAALLSGEKPAALPHLERAITLASQSGYQDGKALATLMLAAVEPSDTNGHLQSIILAQSSLAMFRAAGNEYGAARAESLLGFFISGSGDLEKSKCLCQHALTSFERMGDLDHAATALNALALNANLSGDPDDARRYYQRAERLFTSAGDYVGRQGSIAALSRLQAKPGYLNIVSVHSRKHSSDLRTLPNSLIGAAILNQAAAEERANHYKEANEAYDRAFRKYQMDGNKRGQGTVRMRQAILEANHNKLDESLARLAEAQTLKQEADEVGDEIRIQYLRASVLLKQNQLEQARAEIEKASQGIESQRLQILKFDSRAQYFASVHDYYSLYIKVLMRLDKTYPNQGYARLAFEASEKSKVRALLDLLSSNERASPCDEPQMNATAMGDRNSGTVLSRKEDLADTQALTLSEIQSSIGDGETSLLEYALDKDESFAWLIDGKTITAIELGPSAEIQESVRMFRRALAPVESHANEPAADFLRRRQAARNALTIQSQRLTKLLLGPVRLRTRRRLLIVPDGALQYMPFAALYIPEDGKDHKPLISKFEVSMLPSASTLIALRRLAAGRPQPDNVVAVFGDPVFERPGTPPTKTAGIAYARRSRGLRMALQDSRGSQQIPSLPGSRSEALAIQEVFKSGPTRTQLALDYAANREAILSGSIARQRIIHFATHGIIDIRHPEMSGLLLSMFNKRGQYQDGYLRLRDIYNLKLSADLVVLSSCESALGKDLGSEGIIGLPRGFLHAGARRVVASLWKVDDDATVSLMRSFYTRLERGDEPARALHGAQLDLLKDERLSDPYYWAGFVLEGDYK